jgi:hypothetical protein
MSNHAANDILTFPYWPMDRTQDEYQIPGVLISHSIQDLDQNRIPAQTDYNLNFVSVLMRPAVRQDTSQMGTLADHPTYGVANPGGLYRDLLSSVPDVAPSGEAGKKKGAVNYGP